MLLPNFRDDLLHDGNSDLAKDVFAYQGFEALEVVRLHLIFLVLVEEVHLEGIQALRFMGADLARVNSAYLDDDTVGAFSPAFVHMSLGEPHGPEGLLAAWALLVGRGIALWVLLSLFPEIVFALFSALRDIRIY